MNLGNRRITNADLIACFEALGFSNVGAFLASGNIVFEAKGGVASLTKAVEKGLRGALDYQVPTFIRAEKEVVAIASGNPFAQRKGRPPGGKRQVAFLKNPPPRGADKSLKKFESARDWLTLESTELHWWPDGGISSSDLDLKGIEKLLGPLTIRTHRTIDRMVAKYFS
jgi:uncharacterized protein (DUF1697 family)